MAVLEAVKKIEMEASISRVVDEIACCAVGIKSASEQSSVGEGERGGVTRWTRDTRTPSRERTLALLFSALLLSADPLASLCNPSQRPKDHGGLKERKLPNEKRESPENV